MTPVREWPTTELSDDGAWVRVPSDDPILDYLVIEPSGVVLAVDREKLREAAEAVVRSYHEPAGPLACSIDALAAALKEEDV